MDKTQSQIILTLWRDLTVALLALYFILLIGDAVLGGFVSALMPVGGIGFSGAVAAFGYIIWTRSHFPSKIQ